MPVSWAERMIHHRRWMLVVWLFVIIVAGFWARNVTHHLTATGFDNPRSAAVWADHQVGHLPTRVVVEPLLIQQIPYRRIAVWAHRYDIPKTWLYRTGTAATTVVPARSATRSRLIALAAIAKDHGAHLTWVSPVSVAHKVIMDSRATLAASLPVALPFLIVLLLLVFGSVAAAILPLVVAGIGGIVALGALDQIENAITLSTYLTDIVSFLALGVGVDYALFISARFRQALAMGKAPVDAVVEAMQRAGRSVVFSGIAVALAILTLFLGGNPYWRGVAVGGAVAVISVLLVTHTLLPVLLEMLGDRINWGRVGLADRFHRFWPAVAGWLRRYPVAAIALAVVALGMPAVFGRQMVIHNPANISMMLPRNDPLRQSVQAQQRAWGPGTIAPLLVVMHLRRPLTDAASWAEVSRIASRLANDPRVLSVASPTNLRLSPAVLAAAAAGTLHQPVVSKVLATYTNLKYNRHFVTLFVTSRYGPDNTRTVALVKHIQTQLSRWLPGQRVGVGGITALLNGFNQLTLARLPWILAAVALVALGVLFFATGSLWQAALGVGFDALVALATAGILVVTVQRGGLGLEAEPLNASIVPLIFVLLFGLSMDYEVILLHRVQELWQRGAVMKDAAANALSMTGGMITGAGMIMVVVFIALLLSPLEVMKTLAIGLTSAIMLDTWIVRSLLVPGSIVAIGRSAFWPGRQRVEPAADGLESSSVQGGDTG